MSDRRVHSVLIVRPDSIDHDLDDSLFWKDIQKEVEMTMAPVSITTVSDISSYGLNKKHDFVVLLLRREDLHIVPSICLCTSVSFVCVCLNFFPVKKIMPICRMFGHVKWRVLRRSFDLN